MVDRALWHVVLRNRELGSAPLKTNDTRYAYEDTLEQVPIWTGMVVTEAYVAVLETGQRT